MVTFGFLAVTYGVALYYVFPLALLSWDASLLLSIFFLILVGMIAGLSILVFNFQSICEIGLTYLLLFWERTSMRNLLKKNLLAHKQRNKLTAMIYTLALACVMCLVIFLRLEIV